MCSNIAGRDESAARCRYIYCLCSHAKLAGGSSIFFSLKIYLPRSINMSPCLLDLLIAVIIIIIISNERSPLSPRQPRWFHTADYSNFNNVIGPSCWWFANCSKFEPKYSLRPPFLLPFQFVSCSKLK